MITKRGIVEHIARETGKSVDLVNRLVGFKQGEHYPCFLSTPDGADLFVAYLKAVGVTKIKKWIDDGSCAEVPASLIDKTACSDEVINYHIYYSREFLWYKNNKLEFV